MKKVLLAIIAIGALSAVYFYANQTPPPTAVTAPTTVASTPTASLPLPVVKPVVPAISAPKISVAETKPAAPVPAPMAPATQSIADSPAASSSPRSELATTIPELARLIDAQDFETLMQDFMPPEELNMLLTGAGTPGTPMPLAELASRMSQNPKVMQQMAGASQFLKYLQTQTPTFDTTGESASYPLPKGINGMDSINFVKISGNWYVKNGVQFFK